MTEDKKGIVIRMYESKDSRGKINFKFGLSGYKFKEVWLCDLMEKKEKRIESNYSTEKGVIINYKPYEIITLKFLF